jgi:predicted P-loop ATPase
MTEEAVKVNSSESFDIRDHVDKLTPSGKKKGKYLCPICGDDNLGINPKDGSYQCWSNHCDTVKILKAIVPADPTAKREYRIQKSKPRSAKEKNKAAHGDALAIQAEVNHVLEIIQSGSYTQAEGLTALAAWCKQHGHDVYSASQQLKEKLKTLKEIKGDDDEKPRLLKEYETLQSKFGDRLRFNTLFKQVELDGEPFDASTAKIEFIIAHGMKLKSPRDDIGDITVRIAKQQQYNPVAEYLDRVYGQYGRDTQVLEDFADRYFGTDNPIHQTVLCRFLIGAVARAYQPGCQFDNALILQGHQGAGKSSFFRILASEPWFDDSLGNASDKDERLKLHRAWFIEWAELETLFRRKDIAQVKAFMTTKIDLIRPPYGRSIEALKRGSIFVGTTNQQDFLTDSTGNRRFWVIPTTKDIDIKQLRQERDRIWAAATALFKNGVAWWLTKDEEAEIALEREAYESEDPWLEDVAIFCEHKEQVAIWEILQTVFEIEKGHHDRRLSNRVRDCLIKLGWIQKTHKTVKHLGIASKVWIKDSFLPFC